MINQLLTTIATFTCRTHLNPCEISLERLDLPEAKYVGKKRKTNVRKKVTIVLKTRNAWKMKNVRRILTSVLVMIKL